MKPEARIKEYMEARGISQAFVSRETGISTVKLNLALNGNRRLSLADMWGIDGVSGLFFNAKASNKKLIGVAFLSDLCQIF